MKGFAITASIIRTDEAGYTGAEQVPTFYLLANVQGLLTEDAAVTVAERILNRPDATVHLTAVEVEIGTTFCHTHHTFDCPFEFDAVA